MSNQSIALLYFSYNAEHEANNKRWFGSKRLKNLHLAKALIKQSTEAIAQAKLPVFHFHERNQKGNTFGERISNAYQALFDKGFDAVIAIGNDSPGLVDLDWNGIKSSLMSGKNVIGKSIRGGAYLIGVTADSFQKEAFKNLPWQSSSLYAQLYTCLNEKRQVLSLHLLRDLNTFFDLKKVDLRAKKVQFHYILSVLLTETHAEFTVKLGAKNTRINRILSLRAPPKAA